MGRDRVTLPGINDLSGNFPILLQGKILKRGTWVPAYLEASQRETPHLGEFDVYHLGTVLGRLRLRVAKVAETLEG